MFVVYWKPCLFDGAQYGCEVRGAFVGVGVDDGGGGSELLDLDTFVEVAVVVLVLMVVFYCRKANRGYLLSIIFQTLCFRKAPGASKLESFPRQRYLPFRGFSAFQQSIGCCFWGKWNCKGHLTHSLVGESSSNTKSSRPE